MDLAITFIGAGGVKEFLFPLIPVRMKMWDCPFKEVKLLLSCPQPENPFYQKQSFNDLHVFEIEIEENKQILYNIL